MNTSHRKTLIIILMACLIGSAFGVSFTLTLDLSKPHNAPAGIVATAATRQAADLRLEEVGGGVDQVHGIRPPLTTGPNPRAPLKL
jgi:hypothetical protein